MADTNTTNLSLVKPEVGASQDTWGGKSNTNLDTIDAVLFGSVPIQPDLGAGWEVGGVAVTATAAELNILDGVTASTAELNAAAVVAADPTITALAAYNTNGLLTQTAADTFTGRTLTAGTGTSVTNGDGVSGNPTVDVTTASTAEIQSLSGTNKLPTTAGIATAAALATPSGGADWTPDWSAFISATWVLTGNRTLENPTNVIAGTTRVVRVASDSGTSRTITYGANYKGFTVPSVTDTAVALISLYAVTSSEIVVSAVEYTA
jgi:hypothetical protein